MRKESKDGQLSLTGLPETKVESQLNESITLIKVDDRTNSINDGDDEEDDDDIPIVEEELNTETEQAVLVKPMFTPEKHAIVQQSIVSARKKQRIRASEAAECIRNTPKKGAHVSYSEYEDI